MEQVIAFGRFWYDFIVGDDWTIAAVIALTLLLLRVINQGGLWWVLPVVVVAVLGFSLWRATE